MPTTSGSFVSYNTKYMQFVLLTQASETHSFEKTWTLDHSNSLGSSNFVSNIKFMTLTSSYLQRIALESYLIQLSNETMTKANIHQLIPPQQLQNIHQLQKILLYLHLDDENAMNVATNILGISVLQLVNIILSADASIMTGNSALHVFKWKKRYI